MLKIVLIPKINGLFHQRRGCRFPFFEFGNRFFRSARRTLGRHVIFAVLIGATDAAASLDYRLPANLTAFARRDIPTHKFALRITRATVIGLTTLGFSCHRRRTAVGTNPRIRRRLFRRHRQGTLTIGIAGTSQKLAKLPALD